MPKVGDKFIIEIGEIYSPKDSNSNSPSFNLYRIEGFNSLVFDDFGIQKLLPYDAETIDEIRSKAYEHGRYDATILCEEESKAAYEKGVAYGKSIGMSDSEKVQLEIAYQRGVNAGQLAATGESYAQGLKDGAAKGKTEAWETARRIISSPEEGGISLFAMRNLFHTIDCGAIFKKYHPDEAAKLIEGNIRVGDEVQFESSDARFVVTSIDNGLISGFSATGSQFCDKNPDKWFKTGRHFPIADLLEQMEAPDEGN